MKQTIKLQVEFTKWLKEKGLYNRFSSHTVMQAMYEVWYVAVKQDNSE